MRRHLTTLLATGAICALLLGTAGAQTIDPTLRADIEKLLAANGAAEMGPQMASLVSGQMIDQFRRQQPDIPPRVLEIVRSVFDEEFGRAFAVGGGMAEAMVQIYATHFTPDDVRGLLAFYSSELGRKSVKMMPQVMQEGAAVGQAWAEKESPRIIGVLQTRLKAEGLIP